MKKLLARYLIATLLATSAYAGSRTSSDEVAIRLGADAWVSIWSDSAQPAPAPHLTSVYGASANGIPVAVTRPAVLENFTQWKTTRSGDVAVAITGNKATTRFAFTPEGVDASGTAKNARFTVTLAWERRDGLWQIVRQDISPEPATVAVNDLRR